MMKHLGTGLLATASCVALTVCLQVGSASSAAANDKLNELSKSNENWVMPGKNYSSQNYSPKTQINADNVKNLSAAWSFSTGLLQRSRRHADRRRRQDVRSYVVPEQHVRAQPRTTPAAFSGSTSRSRMPPRARSPAATSSIAVWPTGRATARRPRSSSRRSSTAHVVALNAETGEEYWKVENSDIKVGSTLTVSAVRHQGPGAHRFSSGAELGVRGYMTAYDVQDRRAEAGASMRPVRTRTCCIGDDFNKANPHYGQKGLGTSDLGRRRLEDRRRHELGLVRL